MVYVPEYTEGEIVIFFKEDSRVGKEFVETYVDLLYGSEGVKFDRCENQGDLYVFSVPKGKEDEYCGLVIQDKIIESAERFDARLHRRFALYDQIVSAARYLEEQYEREVDTSGLRDLLDKWDKS